MTYTAAELVTIVAALGVLIASIGSVIVSIIVALRNGQKTDAVAAIVTQARAEQHEVGAKVDAVHVLTNSNLSAVKAELSQAVSKIEGLLVVVSDLKAEREKSAIAQAVATTPPAAPRSPNERATDTAPQKVEIVNSDPVPVTVDPPLQPAPPLPPPPNRHET